MRILLSVVRMIRFVALGLAIWAVGVAPEIRADTTEWENQSGNQSFLGWTGSVVPTTYAAAAPDDLSDKVDFFLYTQVTPLNPVLARVNDKTLFGGAINIDKPMKILIHGYMSHKDKGFSKTMRDAILRSGDYNVVNVDWSKEANGMYNDARGDVPKVGKIVARFIDRLVTELRMKHLKLHLIGHSLGAHIAGVAGLNVKSGRLRRITGLDPAGPLFSYQDKERLMPSSAAFVDVIHTCGKGLGFHEELGHVDFYPNEGTCGQPGCSISLGICSHQRAVLFYIDSLASPTSFLGRKCESWKEFIKGDCDENPTAFMGEHCSQYARGKFMLRTARATPFGLGF